MSGQRSARTVIPRSAASAPTGRLEQVEHEALATLMAAQAGVRVPEVVIAGLGADGDALLVTRQPELDPLELASPDQVSDEMLEELCGRSARLHAAGISHGRLNASNVIVVDDGPMLVDLSAATLGAPQSALDMDVAELLVACRVLVGPDRALRKAVDAGWSRRDRPRPAVPAARGADAASAGSRPHARSRPQGASRGRGGRHRQAEPEVRPLRRVRPKDVLTMAVLSSRPTCSSLNSRRSDSGRSPRAARGRGGVGRPRADHRPAHVRRSGISVRGAVPTPLPLLPCVVLQSAIKFINLTVPSSAGRIGINLRFLQRMGAPRPRRLPRAPSTTPPRRSSRSRSSCSRSPSSARAWTRASCRCARYAVSLMAIVVALVVSVVASWPCRSCEPRSCRGVRSALPASGAWPAIGASDSSCSAETSVSELIYAIALGAACLAYGIHLNLAQLVLVNTSAAILSSVIPSPGGIGPAEAALAAGLIAMGVDESTAFAIAITQRLCTFYLPPIWGYFSLRWLGRHGYV